MNQPLFVSVGSRGLETADPVWVCAHETHTWNLTKVASSQPAYTAGYPHFRVLCVRVDCTHAHLHTEYMCIQVHVCLHTFFPHMLISFFFPFRVMVESIREGEQSRPLPYLFRARGRRLLHWCSRGHPRLECCRNWNLEICKPKTSDMLIMNIRHPFNRAVTFPPTNSVRTPPWKMVNDKWWEEKPVLRAYNSW